MKTQEYFEKEYGKGHIESVCKLNDMISLYALMEEYSKKEIKQVLSDYNDFLLNNGYTDDDIITEHPTALERFLNLDK